MYAFYTILYFFKSLASQYKANAINELETNEKIETDKQMIEYHIVENFEKILNPVNHSYDPNRLQENRKVT